MKKIVFSFLLMMAANNLFAQTVKFGITGGLNESIFSLQNNTNNDNSPLTGFHAGVFSDLDFGKLSIMPSLYYTVKGENK
ncbi:hypothetical protein [Mucilaginibacter sp.]